MGLGDVEMVPGSGGYVSRSIQQLTAASSIDDTVVLQCLNEISKAATLQFQIGQSVQASVLKIMEVLNARKKRQFGEQVDQSPKQVATANDASSDQVGDFAKDVAPKAELMLSAATGKEKDDDDDDDEDDDDEDYEEEDDDDEDHVEPADEDQDVEGDEEEGDDDVEDEGETEDNGEGEDEDGGEEGEEEDMDGDEDADEDPEDEDGDDAEEEDDEEAEGESEEEVPEVEPPKKKRK